MQHVVTFEATPNPKPRALFERCLDPRLKEPSDKLIEHLGFGPRDYLLKSLGGGPLCLAHPEATKSRCKWMIRQIAFAFDKFPSLEELVLIMHKKCAYYSQIPEECRQGDDKEERDLQAAGSIMQSVLKRGTRITLYLADFTEDDRKVSFLRVPTSDRVIPVPEQFLRKPQLVAS